MSWCTNLNQLYWGRELAYGCKQIGKTRFSLGIDINQGLNHNKMHLLGNFERHADLWYRHGGLIHPIIQHIFTTNITPIVHKLIKWEKWNFPLTEKLPSRTLMKRLTWPRRVYKIRRQNSIWQKIYKKSNESMWDCDETSKNRSLLFMSGNELTTTHFV